MFKVICFNDNGDRIPSNSYAPAFYGIALNETVLTYCLTLEAIELELEGLRQAGEDIEAEALAEENTKITNIAA